MGVPRVRTGSNTKSVTLNRFKPPSEPVQQESFLVCGLAKVLTALGSGSLETHLFVWGSGHASQTHACTAVLLYQNQANGMGCLYLPQRS